MKSYPFISFCNRQNTSHVILMFVFLTVTLFSCKNNTENSGEEVPEQVTDNYTVEQQVFCLNMLSNISAHYNGDGSIEDSTTMAINKVLAMQDVQSCIGKWECVWGPSVFALDGKTTNTMFVAQKNNTDTFVVAIAGTDPTSISDWFLEDFNVSKKVPWNISDPKKGNITTATWTGLSVLKTMSIASKEKTVKAFLEDAAKTMGKINVWITGHSLGGALAPAYALHLHNSIKDAEVNIHCLAVAGATPGDEQFAEYYNSILGSTTMRVWNTRDIVPHGYELDMLKEVPNLYGDSTDKVPPESYVLLDGVILECSDKDYTQLTPSATYSFTSAIYTKDSFSKFTDKFIHTFFGQAIFHHIPAYGVYFKTFDFQEAVQETLKLDAPFFTEGAYLRPVYNIKKY